ncbi:MAG TPA: ABC transporter permease [Vicinamibacterales bacterium]|nr:ABC transporter permease [Vicinamibacterales bacterium]
MPDSSSLLRRSFHLAWISTVRQPARTCLGILGIAAVGALLFDMLLLSRGLVLSFRDLLDESGFDIRVLASDAPPFSGPRLTDATELVSSLTGLPEVEAVLQLRVRDAEIVNDNGNGEGNNWRRVEFIGADPGVRSMWRIVRGSDLPDDLADSSSVVINEALATRLGLAPGSGLRLRGRCPGGTALPASRLRVVGIGDFPFDSLSSGTVAASLATADRLCGDAGLDRAEMLLVRSDSTTGAFAAAAAIRKRYPQLYVVTNEELVEHFSRVRFSYFRQISTVLATVTLFFGFLLIAVLLTVSVNQRLGEMAALRAVGLTRKRVVLGVLWESILLVGAGGLLAVPLGLALSVWLEGILGALPEVPADLRFFVFEPRTLLIYTALLCVAAVGAALYPMHIVARLPIAATLRREVIS